MQLRFSFIVPVYNRPNEIRELLQSLEQQEFSRHFEVVIVEDGSSVSSKEVVQAFREKFEISYYEKPNTGPGSSRNYGMRRAKGNYFLILDSDVVLPTDYLEKVEEALETDFVHCFGGPDAAHESFSRVQKAINFAMTSLLTTGGIRGNKRSVSNFQPRSFNMGLSAEAFEQSGGFGNIHPGEDPDLVLRLRKMGYATRFFPEAYVYHKRRIDWEKFYQQVYKFGLVRPVLNKWHPESDKITYWFPSAFSAGLLMSLLLWGLGLELFILIYLFYFLVLFTDAVISTKSLFTAGMAVWAALVQFVGYGFGFSRSTYYLRILKKTPEEQFPKLFFKNA